MPSAALGGLLYAALEQKRLRHAALEDFDRFQTRVSTNAAVMSATSSITWFAFSLIEKGHPPPLSVVLPAWIVVLWLGHAVAVGALALAGRLHAVPSIAEASPSPTIAATRGQDEAALAANPFAPARQDAGRKGIAHPWERPLSTGQGSGSVQEVSP